MTNDAAPNWGNGTYPGAGERLGPAWQRCWDVLADRAWHWGNDLSYDEDVLRGVSPRTLKGLLWGAEKAGLIMKEVRKRQGYKMATLRYRRPA